MVCCNLCHFSALVLLRIKTAQVAESSTVHTHILVPKTCSCKGISIWTLIWREITPQPNFIALLGGTMYACLGVPQQQHKGSWKKRCQEELTATSHKLMGSSPLQKATGRSGQRNFFALTDYTEQLAIVDMLSFQVHKLRLRLLQLPRAMKLRFMTYKKASAFMIISHIK